MDEKDSESIAEGIIEATNANSIYGKTVEKTYRDDAVAVKRKLADFVGERVDDVKSAVTNLVMEAAASAAVTEIDSCYSAITSKLTQFRDWCEANPGVVASFCLGVIGVVCASVAMAFSAHKALAAPVSEGGKRTSVLEEFLGYMAGVSMCASGAGIVMGIADSSLIRWSSAVANACKMLSLAGSGNSKIDDLVLDSSTEV
jgi:hypothetical protein